MSPHRPGSSSPVLKKILTVIEALEAERTPEGFLGRALEQIETVVAFDHACATLSTAAFWTPRLVHARHSSIWEGYFRHYASLDRLPPPAEPWWPVVAIIDPARFGDKEFQRDFAEANRISQTLVMTNLPRVGNGAEGFCFGLFRGPGPRFSDAELTRLQILYPHLQNLFLLLADPAITRKQSLHARASQSGFTRRELEIAGMLCERLSVREIAERLFVSRHTVEKHLEHIYAKLRVSGWRGACDQVLGGEPFRGDTPSGPVFFQDV